LSRHVLRAPDLLERHRSRGSFDQFRILPRFVHHRRESPARRDGVDADRRVQPSHLVLRGEQQPGENRAFRGGVVCVAGLAEDAGRRTDEDQIAVTDVGGVA